jgi:hypothetical protein
MAFDGVPEGNCPGSNREEHRFAMLPCPTAGRLLLAPAGSRSRYEIGSLVIDAFRCPARNCRLAG